MCSVALKSPKPAAPPAADAISIRGARVHNLKQVSCDIPHNALTVITGVSGSGKSSLAFDTIYAEGQRRYVESLSAYARQFLERIEKPDADEISGVAPAIAIRQKNTTRNPRSTVATATEIYDYLRLLYARIGTTVCHNCGHVVRADSVDEIVQRVLARTPGERFLLLFEVQPSATPFPTVSTAAATSAAARTARSRTAKKAATSLETLRHTLLDLRRKGFSRLYQLGRIFEFDAPETLLDLRLDEPMYVVADRLSVSPDIRSRLTDSIEICFREGNGEARFVFFNDEGKETEPHAVFSERFTCKVCGTSYQRPEPQLFSFNNPFGACPRCQGFGNTIDFDLALVIPDRSKTLHGGAIEPWTKPRYRSFQTDLRRFAKLRNIPLDKPFFQLTEEQQNLVIDGEPKLKYSGVQGFFKYLERKRYKMHVRVFLSRYRGYAICPECHGTRLRPEARAVQIAGKAVTDVCRLTVSHAREFFEALSLTPAQESIAGKVLHEIRQRVKYLEEVGLDYVTLDRLTSTLSGGEAQRIQLAGSLGSHLVDSLYVLDEPSIGLHPRDTHRLIRILQALRDEGNTVIVVEHDAEMMRAADYLLDLGPGAGELGGRVVFAGPLASLNGASNSLTARYLRGEQKIAVPSHRRRSFSRFLKLHGARANNLKQIDVMIPLGALVCISGVSGSGKSTLVHDVLHKAVQIRRMGGSVKNLCDRMEGDAHLKEVVLVDQSPIGRTPRSNPATYMKAYDAIREVFASTPEAESRGFGAGHFSFNIPGGRCETCQGDGTVTVEMQFLANVELVCEECHGTRFKSSILEVRYRGKNVHEVLQLTVREALAFFSGVPKVTSRLALLEEVGLGYVRLGQSATTLSGGEAQRLKLASHLTRQANEGVLYILDEPTTGLHFDDIQKLLAAFRRLLDAGASLLVIEHNLDVLKSADWLIDLGPDGGERGGKVVATGTPEQVARNVNSMTGKFLAPLLNNSGSSHAGH